MEALMYAGNVVNLSWCISDNKTFIGMIKYIILKYKQKYSLKMTGQQCNEITELERMLWAEWYPPPKVICWSLYPSKLKMWLFLRKGSKEVIELNWGNEAGP